MSIYSYKASASYSVVYDPRITSQYGPAAGSNIVKIIWFYDVM